MLYLPFLFPSHLKNYVQHHKDIDSKNVFFLETSPDYFIFGVYQPMKTLEGYPCEIASIAKDYRKIGNGFIFQQNWPYTRLINFHILKVPILIKRIGMYENKKNP